MEFNVILNYTFFVLRTIDFGLNYIWHYVLSWHHYIIYVFHSRGRCPFHNLSRLLLRRFLRQTRFKMKSPHY